MESSLVKSNIIEILLQEIKKLENDFSEILLTKKNFEQDLYIFKLEYDKNISPFYLEKLKIDVKINEILKKRGIPLDRFEKDTSYHPEIIDEELYNLQKEYFEKQNLEKEKIEENIRNMSKEESVDFKKLYKKLAMKFHPDKFINQPEKQPKALELMKKINQAFQEQDIEKLQKIEAEGFDLKNREEEINESILITRKNDLENNIENIHIDIEILQNSDLYKLYETYKEYGSEKFYQKIIEDSKEEIEKSNKLLQILKEMPI